MADLEFGVALSLAKALTRAGHPWDEDAVRWTALDLMKWCTGYMDGAKAISPEEQAQALIDYVCKEWKDWPKGAPSQLREQFDRMFPSKAAMAPPAEVAELAARGHLAAPCEHCAPGDTFCEYGGRKGHAKFVEEQKYWAEQREKSRPRLTLVRQSKAS